MICVTGDIHGDITRFNNKNIRKLRKNDVLIVCGDFGFIWDGTKKEQRILKKLGKKPYYILFADGCHENFDLLNEYPVSDFCGGKVRVISGRLMHAERGSIFDIDGKKVFIFGGGQSADIDIRSSAKKWWEAELPVGDEIAAGANNLSDIGNEVDYIITHEPPGSLKELLGVDTRHVSEMHSFFDAIKENCRFKMWFFGKCHKNKIIPSKYKALFDECVIIDNQKNK